MIHVNVFYPWEEGQSFDWDYYQQSHLPLIQQTLGASMRGIVVEKGLVGATPDAPPRYIAMAHMRFDSIEAFQNAFAHHADAILADIPKYSSVAPILQISEALSDT
jgi:uncharacterized protein (TIGR02118 family)